MERGPATPCVWPYFADKWRAFSVARAGSTPHASNTAAIAPAEAPTNDTL
jgi:hypothetical protein